MLDDAFVKMTKKIAEAIEAKRPAHPGWSVQQNDIFEKCSKSLESSLLDILFCICYNLFVRFSEHSPIFIVSNFAKKVNKKPLFFIKSVV